LLSAHALPDAIKETYPLQLDTKRGVIAKGKPPWLLVHKPDLAFKMVVVVAHLLLLVQQPVNAIKVRLPLQLEHLPVNPVNHLVQLQLGIMLDNSFNRAEQLQSEEMQVMIVKMIALLQLVQLQA
jgi:hypothetical protein